MVAQRRQRICFYLLGADLACRQVYCGIDKYRQVHRCQLLGKLGQKLLTAHHIDTSRPGKRLRYDPANGVVAAQRIAVADNERLQILFGRRLEPTASRVKRLRQITDDVIDVLDAD